MGLAGCGVLTRGGRGLSARVSEWLRGWGWHWQAGRLLLLQQEPLEQEPLEQEPLEQGALEQGALEQELSEQEPLEQEPLEQVVLEEEPMDEPIDEPADEPIDEPEELRGGAAAASDLKPAPKYGRCASDLEASVRVLGSNAGGPAREGACCEFTGGHVLGGPAREGALPFEVPQHLHAHALQGEGAVPAGEEGQSKTTRLAAEREGEAVNAAYL